MGFSPARTGRRAGAIAVALTVVLTTVTVTAPWGADRASAAAAPTPVTVVPSDFSSRNSTAATTGWDTTGQPRFDSASVGTGTRWVQDLENKTAGTFTVGGDGVTLSVVGGGDPAAMTKEKLQYYVGTGGYPAIDTLQPTLATLFDRPLSWTQTLADGGRTDYGITLQVKLQKQLDPNNPNSWARVTVVSVWQPGSGFRDFNGSALWFANSDIHADGYQSGAVVNRAGSGPGVSIAQLLANFGDFQVVSFGPNLGRDYSYDYTVQDFSALGQTFHFTDHGAFTVPAPPTVAGSGAVGAPLTVTDSTDAWSPRPTTMNRQWFRTTSGAADQPIGGATGTVYTPTVADLGHGVYAKVTGSAPDYAEASAQTRTVTVTPQAGTPTDTPSGSAPTSAPTPPASVVELPARAQLPTAVAAVPAPAAGTDRQVTMDLGSDYANQWYYVVLYSTPTVIGWQRVGADGVLTFRLPESFPAGTHTVALLDESGTVAAYVSGITVPEPAAAETAGTVVPASAGEPTDALAETGTDVTAAGLWGLLALVLGAGALVGVQIRRRRLNARA
ncbi:MAG TPA: hypothetical protein VGC45_04265 [Gryllotalpicola sp.]